MDQQTMDPLEMPTWLTDPRDRRWWAAARLTVRTLKARANTAYTEGMKSWQIAERARLDYAALAQENRDRFAARGYDAFAADAAFGQYAVAKDCIDTEQMHGRWATERLLVARTNFAKVNELLAQMEEFLKNRRAARPSPAPRQRSGS